MKRIIHIGLGNFHRAHQAYYTAKAGDWSITGVIMTNGELSDHLARFGNEYVLGTWSAQGLIAERISIYDDVFLAKDDSSAIVEKIADPDSHIITVTITEKGYHLKAGSNRLDLNALPIKDDLASDRPSSAIGLIASGLIKRFMTGREPMTIISCDNLSNNGQTLQNVLWDYLEQASPETLAWAEKAVSFPSTMVDRITPRLTEEAVLEIDGMTGGHGFPVVGTETFSEWIIEDNFSGPRPDWERVGVLVVSDVASYEERKLRLLNGAHSYLAYAGLRAGYQFVHQAINDASIRDDVNRLWNEAASTISEPASVDISNYRNALLDRFSVPAMRHSLSQIAMDGSIKLRERLLPILVDRQAKDRISPMTEKAIRTWAQFATEAIKANTALDDPNFAEISKIIQENPNNPIESLVRYITTGAGAS